MINRQKLHQIFYIAALALAFFMPLSRAGISFFTGILTLLWIINGNFAAQLNKVKKEPFFWALGIFICYMTATLLWSDNLALGRKELLNYYYYLPLILFLYTMLEKQEAGRLLWAFFAGMTVSVILSYGIYWQWWHKEGVTVLNPSPFMHHIIYSIYLAMAALLLLSTMLHKHRARWQDSVLLFLFFLVVGNLLFAWGRTGQVAFVIGLLFLTLTHIKVTRKSFGIALLIVMVGLWGILHFSTQVQTKIDKTKEDITLLKEDGKYDTSIGGRIAMEIVGWEIVKAHPLFGVGIGDLKQAVATKVEEVQNQKFAFITRYDHLHNQYLQILVQGGFVGFITFLALFYTLMMRIGSHERAGAYALILFIVYLSSFFMEVVLRRQFGIMLFVWMVSLILLLTKEQKSNYQR